MSEKKKKKKCGLVRRSERVTRATQKRKRSKRSKNKDLKISIFSGNLLIEEHPNHVKS